jgi:hypothetical protein
MVDVSTLHPTVRFPRPQLFIHISTDVGDLLSRNCVCLYRPVHCSVTRVSSMDCIYRPRLVLRRNNGRVYNFINRLRFVVEKRCFFFEV